MALANKYRPSKFSEVIGQEAAVVALKNIIKKPCIVFKYSICKDVL